MKDLLFSILKLASCFYLIKLSTLPLQNNPGILGDHSPRTPGSILLLWMENCGAEMVC